MRRTIFFSFADHASKRCVTAIAGHEVRIWIGAMIEQEARDGDGVVIDLGKRQPGEAQIEERLPSFWSNVFEDVFRATDIGAVNCSGGALFARRLRALFE